MKNKIIFLAVITLVLAGLTSCDKDTSGGLTRITYYPVLTVLGDEVATVNKGETYTDAGVYVELNGEDISDQVVVTSTVNTSKIGIYTVSYKVTNEDGFSATATRSVFVVDHTSLASAYFGESYLNDARHYYGAPIIIEANNDGTYTIDDLVGGFQFWGLNPGFEPAYDFHFETVLELHADNSITARSYGSWYSGFPAPVLTSGTYDPATGTVTLNVGYSSNSILVTLTK
jgi:hypothetical protein